MSPDRRGEFDALHLIIRRRGFGDPHPPIRLTTEPAEFLAAIMHNKNRAT